MLVGVFKVYLKTLDGLDQFKKIYLVPLAVCLTKQAFKLENFIK